MISCRSGRGGTLKSSIAGINPVQSILCGWVLAARPLCLLMLPLLAMCPADAGAALQPSWTRSGR